MNIFVARQPIFTRKKNVFGYEMLFRNGLENSFPNIDGDTATSKVLSNTFFSFDLNEILGKKPGLINFTKELILQKTPLLFPKEHIIIEVLEDIEPDKKIISALSQFKKAGFRIALDDFIYDKKFIPMIELCSIIKFDLVATPLHTLEHIVKDIQSNYRITLLAEKVETYEEFETAKKMGFALFQGYFFSKPEILSKKDISSTQISKLKLINEMGKTKLNLTKIEQLIKMDVSVSFKLLKFINSAYFNRPSSIDTIKDAMTYLGTDELKKFINVVAVSGLNESKPDELVKFSMIRARMCELCATVLTTHFTSEELFTIGLFSRMDAMMDMSMENILGNITFSNKIKTALLGNDPQCTKILSIIESVEKGNWEHDVFSRMAGSKIIKKLPGFYLDSIKMADTFFN